MKTYLILILASMLVLPLMPEPQKNDSARITDSLTKQKPDLTKVKVDTIRKGNIDLLDKSQLVTARLRDFPTLHPLIVHFAISLIFVAALLQLLNLFLIRKEISWIILLLVLAGFGAALLASRNFHPHTSDLNARVAIVLGLHEQWAGWTVRTSLLSAVFQLAYLLLSGRRLERTSNGTPRIYYKKNSMLMVIVTILLVASATCVLKTGYYGAQLVHIEGVGPQGKYLETED